MADPVVYSADREHTLTAIMRDARHLRARLTGLPEDVDVVRGVALIDELVGVLSGMRERNRRGADPDAGRWASGEWG